MNQKPQPGTTTVEALRRWKKTHPSFPLSVHATGWVKKIGGQVKWVCSLIPPVEAEKVWDARKAELRGEVAAEDLEKVAPASPTLTAWQLVNYALADYKARFDRAKITAATYANARRYLRRWGQVVGPNELVANLTPAHFVRYVRAMEKHATKGTQTARATRKAARFYVDAMFRNALDNRFITSLPTYGKRFNNMAVDDIEDSDSDSAEKEVERRTLTSTEAGTIARYLYDKALAIESAGYMALPAWKAYTAFLLSLNGGYGATELAQLKWSRIHLSDEIPIIRQKRGKTKVLHRVALWPETLTALFRLQAEAGDDPMVFTTKFGKAGVHSSLKFDKGGRITGASRTDSIGLAFNRARAACGITNIPAGQKGYYIVRHTHRSVSGGANDEAAADVLMGHRLPGMRKVYQTVDSARLLKVALHVRAWLNPDRLGLPPSSDRSPAELDAVGVGVFGQGVRRNQGRRGKSATAAPPSQP